MTQKNPHEDTSLFSEAAGKMRGRKALAK